MLKADLISCSFTYLNDCLHHAFLLSHVNGSLLGLNGDAIIVLVLIEAEIQESCIVTLGRVEVLSIVLVSLECFVLLWGDSVSAVDHHLCKDLVHQSVLSLGGVGDNEVLNVFL